jgi:hypothetical protein
MSGQGQPMALNFLGCVRSVYAGFFPILNSKDVVLGTFVNGQTYNHTVGVFCCPSLFRLCCISEMFS